MVEKAFWDLHILPNSSDLKPISCTHFNNFNKYCSKVLDTFCHKKFQVDKLSVKWEKLRSFSYFSVLILNKFYPIQVQWFVASSQAKSSEQLNQAVTMSERERERGKVVLHSCDHELNSRKPLGWLLYSTKGRSFSIPMVHIVKPIQLIYLKMGADMQNSNSCLTFTASASSSLL